MEGTAAGNDWASELHALCVVDADGTKLAEGMFAPAAVPSISILLVRLFLVPTGRYRCGCS